VVEKAEPRQSVLQKQLQDSREQLLQAEAQLQNLKKDMAIQKEHASLIQQAQNDQIQQQK
jgi:molecular chaperone GrpE (heat shock protein)